MSLKDVLGKAWSDHAEDPGGVAERLDEGQALVASAADAAALGGLAAHVLGEHLGRWPDAIARLSALLELEALAEAGPERSGLLRTRGAMRLCGGDEEGFRADLAAAATGDAPTPSERCRALALAASALAGQRRCEESAELLESALKLAREGLPDDDPAIRSIAITGNNLAAELEEATDRDEAATALMVRAAKIGREYWERAGTWMNVERAEYRLAMSLLAAGRPEAALAHAKLCWDIVAREGGDPNEAFFAREVLARARAAAGDESGARADRDAAEALISSLDAGLEGIATATLARLDAALG